MTIGNKEVSQVTALTYLTNLSTTDTGKHVLQEADIIINILVQQWSALSYSSIRILQYSEYSNEK